MTDEVEGIRKDFENINEEMANLRKLVADAPFDLGPVISGMLESMANKIEITQRRLDLLEQRDTEE